MQSHAKLCKNTIMLMSLFHFKLLIHLVFFTSFSFTNWTLPHFLLPAPMRNRNVWNINNGHYFNYMLINKLTKIEMWTWLQLWLPLWLTFATVILLVINVVSFRSCLESYFILLNKSTLLITCLILCPKCYEVWKWSQNQIKILI